MKPTHYLIIAGAAFLGYELYLYWKTSTGQSSAGAGGGFAPPPTAIPPGATPPGGGDNTPYNPFSVPKSALTKFRAALGTRGADFKYGDALNTGRIQAALGTARDTSSPFPQAQAVGAGLYPL